MNILVQLLLYIVLLPMTVSQIYVVPAAIGWIERVRITDHQPGFEVKIDTGVDYTSILAFMTV
jgi:hypothetical protein